MLTCDSLELYEKYKVLSDQVDNLYTCGRLGEFKYYNMDQALENALYVSSQIINNA